ncbi:MAG: hypothetical protein NTZ05_14465 [Chloroflexi bacterium]|nr:hypothetical protein [Chloroflexota bacterium]
MTMRLLYGVTSELVVTIAERFLGSEYYLYFADDINAAATNPPSSNPFRLFFDFREIVEERDRGGAKFVAHVRGVRNGVLAKMLPSPERDEALALIARASPRQMRPYLAILEADTYLSKRGGTLILPLPQSEAANDDSLEYRLEDVHGPNHAEPELHLQRLY